MPSPKDPRIRGTASCSLKNHPLPKRAIVFSDTDNDVLCVEKTLRFAGIVNKKGQFTEDAEGLGIFHTGDLVDKKNPDPAVIEYWESFRRRADLSGCQVKIVAGNHELETWQRLTQGETFGLPNKQLTRILRFIETLDLIHVEDSVLFLHGYPTLAFLRTLLHFREVTGKDPNLFNEDHFRKAFRSAEAINQYAYVQGKAGDNYILADVAEASAYYRKHGRNVVTLLRELDIHTVIHGHRPQRSGRQTDYEFAKSIPGVRMISNDTKVRIRGIGATVIRIKPREEPDIVFINTLTENKKTRSFVRGLLQAGDAVTPSLPAQPPTTPETTTSGSAEIQIAPEASTAGPTTIIETADTSPIEVEEAPELTRAQTVAAPESANEGAIEIAIAPEPSSFEPTAPPKSSKTAPVDVESAPESPPVQPMITPEPLESQLVQPADATEESPVIREPATTDPVEIAPTSRLQPEEPPDYIHTGQKTVDEISSVLPQVGASEGEGPRFPTTEGKLGYFRRPKWRRRIVAAVLAASLAGVIVYWLSDSM